MEFIAHRVNTIGELQNVSFDYGVEIDLRDSLNGRIYIQHDPFEPGEDFEAFLNEYNHGTMILNIKSERIEYTVLELLRKYGVSNYFFLDSSFPMIKQLSDEGEKNIAVRFSEFEGLDTLEKMKGRVWWVWVDTFSSMPIDRLIYDRVKEWGYKLCLVSPELQGQCERIEEYASIINNNGVVFDAICTKMHCVDRWKSVLL